MALAVASQYDDEEEDEGVDEQELAPPVSKSAGAIIDEIVAAADIERVEKAVATPDAGLPEPVLAGPSEEVDEVPAGDTGGDDEPAVEKAASPDLQRMTSAAVHNVFAREETGPGLDGLLDDLLEKGDSVHPTDTTSEFAVLELDEPKKSDEEDDPFDVILSKDHDVEPKQKKRGFFKRMFGKK